MRITIRVTYRVLSLAATQVVALPNAMPAPNASEQLPLNWASSQNEENA